jgi:hypothetical protein
MSQQIPKNEFSIGAGKGDAERPINRKVYRETLEKMKTHGTRGKVMAVKGIKTTYIYNVSEKSMADIGRIGGQSRSERKAIAAAKNGKRGGRPGGKIPAPLHKYWLQSVQKNHCN